MFSPKLISQRALVFITLMVRVISNVELIKFHDRTLYHFLKCLHTYLQILSHKQQYCSTFRIQRDIHPRLNSYAHLHSNLPHIHSSKIL